MANSLHILYFILHPFHLSQKQSSYNNKNRPNTHNLI